MIMGNFPSEILRPDHRIELGNSGLTDRTILKYGIRSINQEEASKLLGFRAPSPGWIIEYPQSEFFKIKVDKPTDPGRKYLAQLGRKLEIFITDLAFKAINDSNQPYYFCEGEKKVLALEQAGYAAIGLSGVWGWSSGGQPNKCFQKINLSGRVCYIIYDSDKYKKTDVKLAEQRFAKVLISFGAKVKIVNLNPEHGKGADDQLLKIGEEKFSKYIENAIEHKDGAIDGISVRRPIGSPDFQDMDIPNAEHNIGSVGPTYTVLVNRYGEPYYFSKNGGISSVNQTFWAGLHNEEHTQLYESNEGAFYRYDEKTGLYRGSTEHVIMSEIAERMLEVSRANNVSALESKRTATTLTAIIKQLKGISEKADAFVKTENYVHLANGVLVLDDNGVGELKPFSPAYFSRNSSPINFDEKAQCDRFLNELLLPAVGEEDALLIQKYVGICLLGNNLCQRILILEGLAARGKSTLSLVIQQLIGQTNVAELRTRLLGERFELYRYLKKTLLIGVDVPGGFLSERGAQQIKGLVGGDMKSTEKKGSSTVFQIKGNFCVVINSNSRLYVKLDGDTGAWERRLLIVRYKAPPPRKKIPDFDKLLIKEEGSGILNWALAGLGLLIKDINTYGDIWRSSEQKAIVDALLAESDSLRHYLKDQIVKNESEDLAVSEIVEGYAEYCPTKGWNPKPITIIHKEMEGLMLELFGTVKSNSIQRMGRSARGFRRVGFKDEQEGQWG